MKLYATTTSERASKGQGGNKYLEVTLQAGVERRIIGILKLQEIERGNYALDFYKYGGNEGECIALLQDDEAIKEEEQKGNKQNNLIPFCNLCGQSVHIDDGECTDCMSTDIGYIEKGNKQKGEI